MTIKKIYVRNFRNIKEAELEFSEGCNIFYGNNAEGKTNMLEAISLCIGKSFRNTKTSSYTPFSFECDKYDKTVIKLTYINDNQPNKENIVKYELVGNKKPTITINDIPFKSAADLYGEMKYVIFIPEHLMLIKGAPELRRDYIDNIVMLQNKSHKRILTDYKNALNQRNFINYEMAVSPRNRGYTEQMLPILNDILAKQGTNITFGRVKYLSLMKQQAISFYSQISDSKEILDLYYDSSVFGKITDINGIDFLDKKQIYDRYIEKLQNQDDVSEDSNYRTKIGAHRDDIVFELNQKNAREFGSQGQLRSISLILKLAEAEMIKSYNQECPVILLDEVLSELDFDRRTFVVNRLGGSQVFITSCNIGDFGSISTARIWGVENGEFKIHSSGQ